MNIRVLPFAGWFCFLVGVVVQFDILASYTATRRMPLGGFAPHIRHDMVVGMSWTVVVLFLVAWFLAIESANFYLLLSLAVFAGKFGQEFSKTLAPWEAKIWWVAVVAALLGMVMAAVRVAVLGSKPIILPDRWASAEFRLHIPTR